MDCLKRRQEQDSTSEYLEKGKEKRYIANQEGNKNIKMHEI